ncbi:MAG: hypothetical protein DMF02_01450, partial [Verrucomicrobia bacterium]
MLFAFGRSIGRRGDLGMTSACVGALFVPVRIHHDQLEVRTNGQRLYEVTDEVQAKIDRSRVR